jgi:hypothetical protein
MFTMIGAQQIFFDKSTNKIIKHVDLYPSLWFGTGHDLRDDRFLVAQRYFVSGVKG